MEMRWKEETREYNERTSYLGELSELLNCLGYYKGTCFASSLQLEEGWRRWIEKAITAYD